MITPQTGHVWVHWAHKTGVLADGEHPFRDVDAR